VAFSGSIDRNIYQIDISASVIAGFAYRQLRTAKTRRREAPMSLDQSKVGRVVAEQMEAIENDYGEDCEIGDVCTIVEVVGPHGSHVRVRSSDMRPHSGLGLIRMAEQAMLGNLGGSAE
jgi:hypothetical protein